MPSGRPSSWRAASPKASSIRASPRAYRNGEPRGTPSADLPPTAFVLFLQNHDQIGNRAVRRAADGAAPIPQALEAAIALLLLCPQIPLIFMGEESASRDALPVLHRPSRRAGRGRARGPAPRVRELRALPAGEPERSPIPTRAQTFERSRVAAEPATTGALPAAADAARHAPSCRAWRAPRSLDSQGDRAGRACWRAGGWATARPRHGRQSRRASLPRSTARRQVCSSSPPARARALAGGRLAGHSTVAFLTRRRERRSDPARGPARPASRSTGPTPWAGRSACPSASLQPHPRARWASSGPRATCRRSSPRQWSSRIAIPGLRSGRHAGRARARGRRASGRCDPARRRVLPASARPATTACASPTARSRWRWRRRAASPSATSRRAQRLWGVAAQIYCLRRAGDGGIGDTTRRARCLPRRRRGRRRCRGAQPGAQPVPRRSGALRSLFAVEPAVPQSAADRSGATVLGAASSPEAESRSPSSRLIDWPSAARAEVRPAAPAVRRLPSRATPRARGVRRLRARGRPEPRRPHRASRRATAATPRYYAFLQWLADARLRRRAEGGAGRRHAHRPDHRSRGRHRPRRQPCLARDRTDS